MAPANGFLAIWSDVEASDETNYLHWLTREHIQERIGIPGFRSVRVFRSMQLDISRYFILYRLDNPSVIGSAPYLARLNAPSAWSKEIMPVLRNFVRGGGAVTSEHGDGQGSVALPIVLSDSAAIPSDQSLSAVWQSDRIVATRILEVDQVGTLIQTTEKTMRKDDRSFAALALVEGLDQAAVLRARAILKLDTQIVDDQALLYHQIFALGRS